MKANREDVVQAALTVERWCDEQRRRKENCDCPFNYLGACKFFPCYPDTWDFERYLRNRGKRYEVDEEFMREVFADKGASEWGSLAATRGNGASWNLYGF